MPSTIDHDLHYPGPDEKPNPKQVQRLAEDTDAALTALIQDTGVRTDLSVTPASGWSIAVKAYRVVGKAMDLRLQIVRNAAAITDAGGSTPGNIADTVVATINDATKRPSMDTFGIYRCAVTSGSSQVNADGQVWVTDLHKGSSISSSDALNVRVTYPIP